MDPKLVMMLAEYMEKTGSISVDARDLLDRMYQHIEKQDSTKTASAGVLRDRAGAIAQKMAGVRMVSGAPLIEGYEMVKEATGMMLEHDQALDLLDLTLQAFKDDHQKQASLEPGRACPSSAQNMQNLSAIDELMADCGISR